ncbi:hypothetical protein Mapa_002381 [Marchantia paleacea]|nr:hypothetical protein Mapa_002381 [Marchantia paleacea]
MEMEKRAQGVSCETLSERSSDQSETTSTSSSVPSSRRSGRKKGKISAAVSRMRDAYVNCMLNAATIGDCSALVYGNGYCGNDFQFKGSYLSIEEEAAYIRSMSQRSAR